MYHPMSYSIKSKAGTTVQTLQDFLRKPFEMYHTATFPAAGVISNLLHLPSDYLANSAAPGSSKTAGFLGFRATTVVTMVLNATKFTQGRLLMAWNPNGELRGDNAVRFRNLLSMTQLPHVEMDVSCDTSVVLRVPYYSVMPYYCLIEDVTGSKSTTNFGSLALTTYSPLATGSAAAGGGTAELSVFVHFEDVELVTPAFTAQSGARLMNKKSDSEAEAEVSISSSLSMVSKAATIMSRIPLLSSFLKPAAWVTAALSDSVARFGFSKPSVETPMGVIGRFETKYMNNWNGADAALPMGFSACNSVSTPPAKTGCDIDEMSLSYIAQIPCYTDSVSWSVTQASGDLIFNYVIGSPVTGNAARTPFRMNGPFYDASLETLEFTPLGLLLENFLYYRGSIIFRLKIVKTSFHSGRLQVAFNPGVFSINIDTTPYLMREYVDIREGSNFEFTLPYSVLAPYIRLGSTYNTQTSDCFGSFICWVENPLTAPDTCSGSVEIIVETFAGPDCKFQIPNDPQFAPACANITRDNASVPYLYLNAQSSSADPCDNTPVKGSFGGITTQIADDVSLDAEIFGEEVLSIKQLLMRATRFNRISANLTYGVYFRNADGLYASASNLNYAAYNTLSVFAMCYGYATGGYKYHVQLDSAGHDFAPVITSSYYAHCPITLPTDGSLFAVNSAASYPGWENQLALSTAGSNVFSFSAPCYNQLPMRLIRPDTSIIDPATSPMIYAIIGRQTNATAYYSLWKSFRDDTRYSFWLGTTPVTAEPWS